MHRSPLRSVLFKTLAVLVLGCLSLNAHAEDKEKPVKPPTKLTQTLSQKVYKQLEAAQQAFDAKQYQQALDLMQGMQSGYAKFNDYEKATYWNFMAAVYYAMDNTPKAIESYKQVLKQENLPEAMRSTTLFALAQLHFVTEDYKTAIQILGEWFKQAQDPQPDAYMLLAQAYYQTGDYSKTEKAVLAGLKKAKERQVQPKENWLALLRAAYYELGNYPRAAKVLELLVAYYPKETYWLQLSGMYGLMGDQKQQLATLHAAYQGGMVSKPQDQLNLARLYLAQEAPYPAVELLTKAFKQKVIEPDVENLQLYAQALSMAKEYDQQIPVLKKLAETSGQSKHYVYLGQAYNETGDYAQATEAFEHALKADDIDDKGSIRMQLGTAQYNAGKLAQARSTFISAASDPDVAEQANTWVSFVSAEIQRKQALNGSGMPKQKQADDADDSADAPAQTAEPEAGDAEVGGSAQLTPTVLPVA
ncbi:tetratricopeptide repeat protein [Sinimarinibacterium sp. CAU 1509]|uniref:tetratricopeptide repeat protein n=1 Tax=Sinimarinibacterium sp. CAU 1509 TaxID=2562283 RepID=UPI0010ACE8DF|nr:tetratricopeptide repeat protein [Sinimarinibacterium sp. CAU 1509]TJY60051.1 tetratricopeptide repeat protein [Sinimarinibacterium sp. CAU 1509]